MGTLVVTTPTTAEPAESLSGDLRVVVGDYTFSSSYTTGGEVLDLAAAFGAVRGIVAVRVPPAGGYTFEYVAATKKLKAYTTAGAEVAAATNLSTLGAIRYVAYVR